MIATRSLPIEAEDLPEMAFQVADVVADAADAELAEVGEVLADLRGVQVELFREPLRRDGLHAGRFELVQAAQVDRQAIGGELGDLFRARSGFVLLFTILQRMYAGRAACYNPRPWPNPRHRRHRRPLPAHRRRSSRTSRRPRPRRSSRQGDPPRRHLRRHLRRRDRLSALKAGLTVSASIPIAVLSIAVFKRLGKSTILENNIVQTIGSAGESIAAGVVFTMPALLFLARRRQEYFRYLQIVDARAVGGILGVLFMVPLRRALIVKEHGNLPYPKGTACADVLIAGERGGELAERVFAGVWHRHRLQAFVNKLLGLWKDVPRLSPRAPSAISERDAQRRDHARVPRRRLHHRPEHRRRDVLGRRALVAGAHPAHLAVRPRSAAHQPICCKLGVHRRAGSPRTATPSGSIARTSATSAPAPSCCAGVMTLVRSLPTIFSSFRDSVRELRGGAARRRASADRTRYADHLRRFGGRRRWRCIIALIPQHARHLPGLAVHRPADRHLRLLLRHRVVPHRRHHRLVVESDLGHDDRDAHGTCLIFVVAGVDERRCTSRWRSCVGAIVCIASANAGATSQDLKTGYLVGATPIKQQIGLIIGVLVSTLVIGGTILLLDHSAPANCTASARRACPRRRAR